MCIIIDANQSHQFTRGRLRPCFAEIVKWVSRNGKIVTGGRLERELLNTKMRALLVEWERVNKIVKIDGRTVDAAEREIDPLCESDDPHVLALVNLSGSTLVVTEDGALIDDLADRSLVEQRVRVYKEDENSADRIDRHRRMLQRTRCSSER